MSAASTEESADDVGPSKPVPPGMTLVVPPKKRDFPLNLIKDSLDRDDDKVLVSTADLNKAVDILHEHGRLIICGPPGSGKTRVADGAQKVMNQEGYISRSSIFSMTTCHTHLEHILKSSHRYVCVEDNNSGYLRLNRNAYLQCINFVLLSHELWDRPPPGPEVRSSVLIITIYPHILKEMQMLDETSVLPLADPKVVLHLTQDPLLPHLPFKPDLHRYALLLVEMLRHEHGRPPLCALLTLTMQGQGDFLKDPTDTWNKIQAFNFLRVSVYQVAELADYLKGFFLKETGIGFVDRFMYEAVGLALGRSYALLLVLQVCDTQFFAEYVRMDPDAKTKSTYLVAKEKLDRPLVLDKMFRGLTEDAALMELCQHPSLSYLEIVQEFAEFCSQEKNYTERVMSVVDAKHKLPLLYWSVWNMSTHLNHWCLTNLEDVIRKNKLLTEPILISLLASILFAESGDSTLVLASGLVRDLMQHKLKATREVLKLNLPTPTLRKEDAKVRLEQVKTRMKVSLCYLEDSRLPLPPAFVAVDVTKESITVQFPSKSWYLLLRLLTDKHPQETDEKGNTALHLAVESGHPEIIKTVARIGVSLTTKNKKGMTPYLLAQKAKHQTEKEDPMLSETRHGEEGNLHAACHEGDIEMVKVLLCLGASLGEKDGRGNTPLHLACRAGHAETAALLLLLKADISVCNGNNMTPLDEAKSSGNQNLVKLLQQGGSARR